MQENSLKKPSNLVMNSNKNRKTSFAQKIIKNETNISNTKLPPNKNTIDQPTSKEWKDILVEIPKSPMTPKAETDEESKKK